MSKNFASFNKAEEDTVMIVDGLNLAFRWKHSGAKIFSSAYIDTVKSLAKSYKCGKTIIAADWGSSAYRKAIYPEYKGNREELRAKQTEAEAKAFEDFIKEYNETLLELDLVGYTVLKYQKVEADDIAAYLCKNKDEFGFNKIWLISSDKDWDLMVNDSVSRFSYVTRKEITLADWPYDVDPEEYLTYKVLVGDTGDNIPGISGIGPKRACSIIEQYGDVFSIHDALPLDGKQKFIQELNNNADRLLLNVELMDLFTYCEEAIGEDNIQDIKEKVYELV